MSENDKYTIKEMVSKLSDKLDNFEIEMREDIKTLINEFHDYKITNNERIAILEGKQKLTWKTIAMYAGFVGIFIMLVVNTYMSFKG